jgi:hypothetical protein
LTLIAPFASWGPPARDAGTVAFPDAMMRFAVGSIVLTLLALVGPVPGAWAALLIAAGTLFAIMIHLWYQRHPYDSPTPTERQRHVPQINFSSTEVNSNMGGLIFMVGSVLIVAVGLPSVIWFLLGSTAAGGLFAWGLVAWHRSHPMRGVPANRIV